MSEEMHTRMQPARSPRIHGKYKGSVGDFCCVPGCSNSRGRCNRMGLKVSFYTFPKDTRRRQLWLDRIRRGIISSDGKVHLFEPKTHSRVCSQHFVGGVKVDEPSSDAYIPSVFLRNSVKKRSTRRAQNAGFLITPLLKSRKKATSAETPAGRPKVPRMLDFTAGTKGKAVWETTDHDYIKTKCENGEKLDTSTIISDEVDSLRVENDKLKTRILSLDSVKDNDDKFQFWTNLPNYAVFLSVSTYMKTRMKPGGHNYWKGKATSNSASAQHNKRPERKFSFEEEFFIVLVKLKTGNFNEDLAQTFGTSPSHISSIFSTWINFLCVELKLLFEMQNNEHEKAECYSSFEDLKIVIDCTELMVQRASNLDARKKTFSNYKHHDTVKFMVGVSPSLAVNFVSQAWGGRASDKHITLESDAFMNGLSAGDCVMADRGFNIGNDLKKKGVKLLIPEFKGRDRPQMTSLEARRSEYISRARIHVERIIQRIKTFYLLERVRAFPRKNLRHPGILCVTS